MEILKPVEQTNWNKNHWTCSVKSIYITLFIALWTKENNRISVKKVTLGNLLTLESSIVRWTRIIAASTDLNRSIWSPIFRCVSLSRINVKLSRWPCHILTFNWSLSFGYFEPTRRIQNIDDRQVHTRKHIIYTFFHVNSS